MERGAGPGIADAAEQLRHFGFLLVSPQPAGVGGSRLLMALRDRPTLEHFDPELIRYWRTGEDRRGHPAELTRDSRLPVRAEFSWGLITVFDRYAIENEFATLGGELIAEETAPDTTVAVFSSPGPILRLGGHSQDVDRVAPELGAFFGRMMVPIDFEPGVEEAISAASPLERYAAFVAWEHARYAAHAALRDDAPATASVLAAEAIRLAGEEPDAWEGGHRLARRMGLEVAAPGPSV
ncbi:MAG TPA: hypothetical protein VJA85_02230 [Candidatus Limnocylindria bacterium]|nr:hypothetical protein [Candidatus Limnocylindria bacterium]